MQRPPGHDGHPHPATVPVPPGQLEHDAVVHKVQRAVQRADRQLGGPVELHLGRRQVPLAGQRPPVGAVPLVTDQGGDDAALVHLADVGAVGDVQLALGGQRDSWFEDEVN